MLSVLITAALSPLGRHFAELFGARGYRLLLNYRGPFHRVEGLLKEYGGEGIPFSFEAGNLPEWLETVEELDPDVLVCNFGPLLFSPWREVEPSRWRESLESNLTLPFF
ncbi:MAG TPA: SDR family oxidoreductase, partial [Candidatus Aminicenantes bacterium]|nr:SDR family oxidoreductase [Candidatus Aminicenantes bacterium]